MTGGIFVTATGAKSGRHPQLIVDFPRFRHAGSTSETETSRRTASAIIQ